MGQEGEILLQSELFRVVRMWQQTDSGDRLARSVVQHPGAVTILPLVDQERVCLIRNYRIAVGQTLIELPAGTLRKGEDPALAARRELIEETGYRADTISPLCDFFMSPGILDERMYVFVATGLVSGEPQREPGEQIDNLLVPWDEALRMVRDGAIQDAKTIVALLHYNMARVE